MEGCALMREGHQIGGHIPNDIEPGPVARGLFAQIL